MKMPKQIRTHCPFCNKHTLHKVKQSKRKQKSGMKKGERMKSRAQGHGGKGRFSKPAIKNWKRTGHSTPRIDLRLECKECKKSHPKANTFRSKKFTIA